MTAPLLMATALAVAAAGALAVLIAGASGAPAIAPGAAAALFGAIALAAQPFVGIAALTAFSHLDAVQKVLFGFLPVSAFKLITAATAAAILLSAPRRRDQVQAALREPVVVLGLLFVALSTASMAGAADKMLAIDAVSRYLGLGLLLVLVVILADSRRKVGLLLWLLAATSLVSSLILLADFALGVQLVAQSEAATTARTVEGAARSAGGSDYNPTTAASLLLVGVVVALVHALESRAWRGPLLILVAIGSAAVVLSFARSAAIAYGVIGLALLWRHRRRRHLPLAVAAGLLAALALLPLTPDAYWQRLSAIIGVAPDPSLGRRLSYNLIGIDLFLQRPLLGVGPGNFVHHFVDPAYRFLPGRTLVGRELHNMYLSVLVQHGLIGALPFFGMLALAFRNLLSVSARPAEPVMRIWALALGYGFAAYLLICLFLPSEEIKYTWLLPGLATALHLVNRRERAGR